MGINIGSLFGTTTFISTMTVICLLLIGAFLMFAIVRKRLHGKMLVFFVEKDKTLTMRLFKPRARYFKTGGKDNEKYLIDTKRIVLVNYPFSAPSFMQQPVPCLVFPRGNPQPLDPETVTVLPDIMTAAELASCTDESVIQGIVKATTEELQKNKWLQWIIPAILAGLILVTLILVWSVSTKIDALS